MAALISSLSISPSLFSLHSSRSLSLALSLFAYGFSFHLPSPWGMQAAQTFCAVCFQELCLCVYISMFACKWDIYFLFERNIVDVFD